MTHSHFPQDPRPRREALVAAEDGRRVCVIALRRADQSRVGTWRSIRVIRLEGAKSRGTPFDYLAEYLDFLLKARRLFARDARFRRARVVHVHTLPDFLIGAALPARRAGARLLLDLHEIFPEFTASKFHGALGRAGSALARLAERWSRRRADAVLTVNDPIAALLAGRPARRAESITVVHNSPDPGEFGPRSEPAGDAGPPLRLVYHGTLTPLYGVDIAVEAVALARRDGLEATLDIFGDGPAAPGLKRQIAAAGLTDVVRLVGAVPAAELRARLPGYHAGFIPTRRDGMTRYSLSTKLLECVHFGLALVVPRLETYLAYFPEECGWYYEANAAPAAAATLHAFAAAPAAERIRRAQAAQRAAERLDWSRDAAVLRDVYRRLLAT